MNHIGRITVISICVIMITILVPVHGQDTKDPTTLAPVWYYTREDNEATFWKLDWSPDGEMIAATFFDNNCIILDSDDGTVIQTLNMNDYLTRCDGFAPEGTVPLRACAFSPDGKYLATGGDDMMVRIFGTQTWELERTFLGHTGSILSLDWSPDSRYLASGSGTDKVIPQNAGENITRIWDIEEGKQMLVLEGHKDGVLAIKWDEKGERLITASDDRTIRIWSFPEGEVLLQMKGHTSGVLDACWSPDESMIVSGSRDYKIKVWNSTTGDELKTWSDYNCVRSVDIHPDGEIVATSGVDLTLKIRDMGSGSELKVIQDGVEQKAMVMLSRWSPDGNMIASGLGKSHTVVLYSFGKGSADSDDGFDMTVVYALILIFIGIGGLIAIIYPAYREVRRGRE